MPITSKRDHHAGGGITRQKTKKKQTRRTPAELAHRQRRVDRLLAEQPQSEKWIEPIPTVVDDGLTDEQRLIRGIQEALWEKRKLENKVEVLERNLGNLRGRKRKDAESEIDEHRQELNTVQRRGDSYFESLRRIKQTTRESQQPAVATATSTAAIIHQLREECGLTQGQLSEEIGMEQSSVSRHERGINPRPYALKKYAEVFSKKLGRSVTVAELKGTMARAKSTR